jgi:hypothetical protein
MRGNAALMCHKLQQMSHVRGSMQYHLLKAATMQSKPHQYGAWCA